VKIILEVILQNMWAAQTGCDKDFTILAQKVNVEGESLNVVVMEMAEYQDHRSIISNCHILEAASGINDDLDFRRPDLEACGVTAIGREFSTGDRNRSPHAMECDLHQTYTPSRVLALTGYRAVSLPIDEQESETVPY
jgi:hypothetical protein